MCLCCVDEQFDSLHLKVELVIYSLQYDIMHSSSIINVTFLRLLNA